MWNDLWKSVVTNIKHNIMRLTKWEVRLFLLINFLSKNPEIFYCTLFVPLIVCAILSLPKLCPISYKMEIIILIITRIIICITVLRAQTEGGAAQTKHNQKFCIKYYKKYEAFGKWTCQIYITPCQTSKHEFEEFYTGRKEPVKMKKRHSK